MAQQHVKCRIVSGIPTADAHSNVLTWRLSSACQRALCAGCFTARTVEHGYHGNGAAFSRVHCFHTGSNHGHDMADGGRGTCDGLHPVGTVPTKKQHRVRKLASACELIQARHCQREQPRPDPSRPATGNRQSYPAGAMHGAAPSSPATGIGRATQQGPCTERFGARHVWARVSRQIAGDALAQTALRTRLGCSSL